MGNPLPVQVQGLDRRFGSGGARKQALSGIGPLIARGSFAVPMGPSGWGEALPALMGCWREVQAGPVRLLGRGLSGAGPATGGAAAGFHPPGAQPA